MKYDDNGNLVLSGNLGEAVISGEGVEEYARAMLSGKSENLSYQDMQDFQDFTSEFFVLGEHRDQKSFKYLVLSRKGDRAAFGLKWDYNYGYSSDESDDSGAPVWVFKPMQPFTIQGYEPAE